MDDNVVSLDAFERMVYARNYDQAARTLANILESIDQKTFDLIPDNVEGDEAVKLKRVLLTRFVAAITAMLSDPGCIVHERFFLVLMLYKKHLVSLFAATSFSAMDHIAMLAGTVTEQGELQYNNENSFFKLMVATSIYSPTEFVLNTLNSAPKNYKLLYWFSLLDNEAVLESRADGLRNRLLDEAEKLQEEKLQGNFIIRLVNVWMFLSYFSSPEKHKAKIPLNRMITKWMRKAGVNEPKLLPRKVTATEKPRLLVISEKFTANHAMFRCHGPSISQLRSKFHTVLVAGIDTFDDETKLIFDEVVSFNKTDPIKQIVGKIIKAKGDLIYYPSVGMEAYSIMASQLRLAPIQMFNLGHPATTYCEQMDYALVEGSILGDPECFSETIVVKNEGAKFNPHGGDIPEPVISDSPDVIKIAIPAIRYKLNPAFLKVCREVRERSRRKVEFHFFPNCVGIMLDFVTEMIRKSIPDAVVHPSKSYFDYMTDLGACDIHFSTFPFGLTNGIVDSSLCALPIIALDGPEPHSHADAGFQQRLGLPDWLTASSEEEYIETALRLVENDELRVEVSQDLIVKDPRTVFYADPNKNSDYFVNLLHWIYRNHDEMQRDGRKVWDEKSHENWGDIGPVDEDQSA